MNYESLLKLSYIDNDKYKSSYLQRFNNECATVLDFEINGNQAFYLTTPEILLLITKILKTDQSINTLTARLPKIALLQFTKQMLVDEIKQTNDIENVYSTRKEINETVNKIRQGKQSGRFKGLVSKYIKLENKEKINLQTCQDIKNLYDEIVLEEVLENDKDNALDGVIFRKSQVSVHSESNKEIHRGVFPESKIIDCLTKALNILNNENVNYLISAAIFHYLFAYIHPFYDGNGRTDRFISSYYISQNLNHLVAYNFSYTLKTHKSQYYKMFSDTNNQKNKGDLTPFIIQFLEFIYEAEKNLLDNLKKRNAMLDYFAVKIMSDRFSKSEKDILYVLVQNSLFADEGISADVLVEVSGKSMATIRKVLKTFDELELLKITKIGKKLFYDVNLDGLKNI